jgi:hypothetical protein
MLSAHKNPISHFSRLIVILYNISRQPKEEAGSAGEQPASNKG